MDLVTIDALAGHSVSLIVSCVVAQHADETVVHYVQKKECSLSTYYYLVASNELEHVVEYFLIKITLLWRFTARYQSDAVTPANSVLCTRIHPSTLSRTYVEGEASVPRVRRRNVIKTKIIIIMMIKK